MDRGYLDFKRLHRFTLSSAFFVTRTKENVLLQRRYSHLVDENTGVRSDQTVILTTIGSAATAYPDPLRRVSYVDPETKQALLVFPTNNLDLAALTIAQIYRSLLAGRAIFLQDQTAPENQSVLLRQHRERREDPNLIGQGSRSTCSSPSSASVWGSKPRFTRFYRFSASRFSRKRPFYRHFKHATQNDSLDSGNQLILFDF